MKWILIIGAAGLGYLYWKGNQIGPGNPGVADSLQRGWTATLGDLHLGPCSGCAGTATAAPTTSTPPQPIMLGM